MAGYEEWVNVLNSENPVATQQQMRPKINTGLDAALVLGSAYLQKKGQEKRQQQMSQEYQRILQSENPREALKQSTNPILQNMAMQLEFGDKTQGDNVQSTHILPNGNLGYLSRSGKTFDTGVKLAPKYQINDGVVWDITKGTPVDLNTVVEGGGQTPPQQNGGSVVTKTPQQILEEREQQKINLDVQKETKKLEAKQKLESQQAPKLNGEQSLTVGFVDRLVFSEKEMQKLIDQGYDPTTFKVNILQNIIGDGDSISMDMIARANLSPQQRQFISAMQNFITANLRKESGAAISAEEFKKEMDKYFPQYGDDAQTLEMKRRSRAQAMKSLSVGLPPRTLDYFSPKSKEYIRTMTMKKIRETATGKEFWYDPETGEMEEITGGY